MGGEREDRGMEGEREDRGMRGERTTGPMRRSVMGFGPALTPDSSAALGSGAAPRGDGLQNATLAAKSPEV
jgi:hypothetical protein